MIMSRATSANPRSGTSVFSRYAGLCAYPEISAYRLLLGGGPAPLPGGGLALVPVGGLAPLPGGGLAAATLAELEDVLFVGPGRASSAPPESAAPSAASSAPPEFS